MYKYSVLDKGMVELIDHMGSDSRIAQAARVSTGSKSKDEERDKKLIEFLIKNGHETPFEHVVFTKFLGSKAPHFNAGSRSISFLQESVQSVYEHAMSEYEKMLEKGIAREIARIVLPVGIYTEFFWTVNLRSLFNFFNLRLDSHAQYEIKEYAIRIAQIVKQIVPFSFSAFANFAYKGDFELDTL